MFSPHVGLLFLFSNVFRMRSILRHCGAEQQQPSCLVARPHWAATQFISSPMFPLAWGRVAHSYFVAGERADLGRWPRSWGSLRCTAHRHRTRGTPLRRGTGQSERLLTQATLPLHARISGWRHFQFSFRATHFATQVLPAHPPCLAHLSSSTGGGGGGAGDPPRSDVGYLRFHLLSLCLLVNSRCAHVISIVTLHNCISANWLVSQGHTHTFS